MSIIQDGDAFNDYTKFKTYALGVAADVLWEESGGTLIVKTCHHGHMTSWTTRNANEKTAFHADFESAYEVK